MRFLIIGASGFIGSHILAYTKAVGHESIGTQSKDGNRGLITFNLLKHRIGDCFKPFFFRSDQPVYVVICAALSQIDRCLLEKETSNKINVTNTIRLINDIKEHGAIPVFISTSAVYDGSLGYYNEDSPHAPICEYGRQKEKVEQFLINEVHEAFILRLDKIVGDDAFGNHLFSNWYQCIQNNQQIICIDQLFSPTFVKDIAKAIVLGCELKLTGAYNVANPEFFTRFELAIQFAAALGKKTEIILKAYEEFNFSDHRLVKSYMDGTRFIKATGIRFTSMREVIHSFLLNINYLS